MGLDLVADIGIRSLSSEEGPRSSTDMPDPHVCKCPGCGSTVVLPPDLHLLRENGNERRIDQLAQSLCGCWVVKLSDRAVSRLLGAVMAGDGLEDLGNYRAALESGR
jgi:hypothetical protein